MMRELQDEMEGIEESIKDHMGEEEELLVDGIRVKWTRYTSNRLDSVALKKELPDIAQRYNKTVESRRFSIA